MSANCFRFAPRDSVPGLIAKICKYLKDHPGWSEEELEEQIKQFVGQTGVASFNGRTGDVILTDNDVNSLKISSAYFAEGNETIDELNLVELYKQGIRFVFTNWNSVTSGYDKSFVLDYFSGSGNVVYYPIASVSGGSSESPVVSVNKMVGAVTIPVVDVSESDSQNQFAKIFINEGEDYPISPSYDSDRLGGKPPSYYANSESVTELYNGLAPVAKSGSYNDLNNKPVIPIVPTSLPNPNKLIMTGAVTAEYDGSIEVRVEIPAGDGSGSYILPVASATQLGGVMPVAKTDEMTQAVGVDADGKLWGAPGGSGESAWRVINQFKLEEDVYDHFNITTDSEGNAFSCSELLLMANLKTATGADFNLIYLPNGIWKAGTYCNSRSKVPNDYSALFIFHSYAYAEKFWGIEEVSRGEGFGYSYALLGNPTESTNSLTSFKVWFNNSKNALAAGSIITLLGKDK